MFSASFSSPIGTLFLSGTATHLTQLRFKASSQKSNTIATPFWYAQAVEQLGAYFDGQLQQFDLPLFAAGTSFQQSVWQTLLGIPFGKVCSYRELAKQIERPTAIRAVAHANANALNPISIIIPCHRIIGSDSSLRGYAGGLDSKAFLLKLEGHHISHATSVHAQTRIVSNFSSSS